MMPSNLDRYKSDLDQLLQLGKSMTHDLEGRHLEENNKLSANNIEALDKIRYTFESKYQRWYSEAYSVINQLTPQRISEFEHLYKGDGKRRAIDAFTYTIQDWFNGVRASIYPSGKRHFDDIAAVTMRFKTQLAILDATSRRFESTLFDIRQLVQADLFDSELEAARELLKHGFIRGAGAIAGVVLEKDLAQVCLNHNLSLRKQHPAISDLNDNLKNAGVVDTPAWRGIQRLGDLRNLCDHSKSREPSKEDVSELIDGTEKVTKTLY